MNRERRTELDHILVALDINDSSRKIELRIFNIMVVETEIRVHDRCLDSVADVKATIGSNIIRVDIFAPRSPESSRALSKMCEQFFWKKTTFVICLG